MEGDFRRPTSRPDGFTSGRPLPQPSQRPVTQIPVTDLRPTSPVSPTPAPQPQPSSYLPQPQPAQPVNYQAPANNPPAPASPVESTPSTAELIAQHERESKAAKPKKPKFAVAAVSLIVIVGAPLIFSHRPPAKAAGPFPASISPTQVTIPVYYPKNLPTGFKVSGSKVVKQDNLNYVVTNANNESFYVNIEAIPAGYNFAAFNQRFTSPTTYQTNIGTATEGVMNNELVCSIQTSKSWVMINSTATKSAADMETIAKALKPATL